MSALLVLSNLPDQRLAEQLAAIVVEERLAACVNILAPCRSVYQWEGKIEHATEIPVLFKTSESRYHALEARIRELHPYDTPEIIAVPIVAGLAGYLGWVEAATRPPLEA
jgi:periplasmic divalent cation tolerance protein